MQWDGATIGWQDQCLKIGAACAISHPIQAFATAADYDVRDEIVQTVNGGAGVYKNLATGQPLNLDGTIGGQVLDANGKVTSASAVRVGFLTKIHETIVDGDDSGVILLFVVASPRGWKVAESAAASSSSSVLDCRLASSAVEGAYCRARDSDLGVSTAGMQRSRSGDGSSEWREDKARGAVSTGPGHQKAHT